MSKSRFSSSSQRWIKNHASDMYVKRASEAGYRSRSVYKLAQIDERNHLLRPNMRVVDLGAAPGGWSQWVKQRLHNQVQIFALDILPMEPVAGVTFIQGDFQEQSVVAEFMSQLGEQKVDLVMSDMAPNLSGMRAIDQPRSIGLAESARDFALDVLALKGNFLTKVFQGEGFESYVKELRPYFNQVLIRKPKASRKQSAEVYVLAKQYLL